MFAAHSSPIPIPVATALFAAALVLAGVGCGREEIQSYRIPKETRAAAAGHDHEHHPNDGHDHGAAPAIPKITAKVPSGWTEGAAGGMRVARFTVPGLEGGPEGDVSVIPLPSFRGSEFEVVNLWRESIKLPRAAEDELKPTSAKVPVADGEGVFYDMTSTEAILEGKKGRIAAAILERGGMTWFFKLMGTEAMVGAQKDAFLAYLKSVQFEDPPADAPVASAAPADAAPRPGPGPGPGPAADGRPDWTVPPSWKEDTAPAMAMAGFRVAGEGGAAASVSVTRLAGDGGGLLPNINRWRTQLGLNVLSESDLKREGVVLELASGQATLVDMAGRDARSGKDARMLGGVVLRGSESWFFKMTGDPGLVARERAAFEGFVKSIRF
jgi:hypothetical protein